MSEAPYASAIYRDADAEARMRRWYEVFQRQLPWPSERRELSTSLGTGSVLVAGPEGGAPIVCFHGAMAGAPHALGELGDLGARRRLYGVELPGQSVHGPHVRPGGEALGRWALEVLDGLGLERASIFGVSWGGWAALQAAVAAPERVTALALLVPAGIVDTPPGPALWGQGLPMMRYMAWPSLANRDRFMRAMFTTDDPLWAAFIADAMRSMRMDFTAPPLLTDAQLATLTAPTLVIAAEHDLSFPGPALLERCRAQLPNLVGSVLIPDCKHVPPFDGSFTPTLLGHLKGFWDSYDDAPP